ncbi:hypothetical protein [Actinophytocola algeriensis]|uniref:Uncharacterized protein n=1 Tax=Actinophytocola algeriensis TaxID=1768010 RepID=A0A7W7QCJ6_9PSEU|nr:hypothetical protein [Actinophytocola algeriensis]MBB4911062.1 hypothetical protein [Actinophytocola algeriensis]MBE1474055.1 hypothetical protein [Actinophytocola algeriensis]
MLGPDRTGESSVMAELLTTDARAAIAQDVERVASRTAAAPVDVGARRTC